MKTEGEKLLKDDLHKPNGLLAEGMKKILKKDAMTKNDRIFFVLVRSIYRRFSLGSSTVN